MLKKAGKVIFAEACQTGNLLQSKVFGKVVADIVCDKQKFFHIFFLMVDITVSVLLVESFVIPANIHQDFQEFCNDGNLRIGGEIHIFILDFQHKPVDVFIDLWIFFTGDQNGRTEERRDQIQFFQFDMAQAGLKNNSFPCSRGKELVEHTGTYNKNFSFFDMIIVITADNPVVIDNRHDHFKRGMPVRRIVFGFIIVIKTDLGICFVINSFMNSL